MTESHDEPNSFAAEFVAARNPSAYTVEIDGEAVVLDQTSNRLHLLNSSAALLWACFDGRSSLGEICTDIAQAVDASYDQVLSDSVVVLQSLSHEGLVLDSSKAPQSLEREDSVSGGLLPEPDNH